MVKEFVGALTTFQTITVGYLIGYLLFIGIKYHLIAFAMYIRGKGLTAGSLTDVLNYFGYAAILLCIYWFI